MTSLPGIKQNAFASVNQEERAVKIKRQKTSIRPQALFSPALHS